MTVTELLGFPSADGVKAILLAFLQRPEFPITDFESGGVVRTQLELETAVVGDLLEAIAVQMAGGFLDDSSDEWLAILAHGFYGIDRNPAVIAQQTITIACAAGRGPYAISTSDVFTTTDGARYFSAISAPLGAGLPLTLDVIAESPGAARGLVNASPLPGVTVTAAAIKVVGVAPQFGADAETDAALAARCDARWPSLDIGADAEDRVAKWAKASTLPLTVNSITRVRLLPTQTDAGGVIVVVATATTGASVPSQTKATNYIRARLPITDYATVIPATPLTVTAGGTVTVVAGRLAVVKAAASAAWAAMLSTMPIGGTLYLSKFVEIVMDAGAIDIDSPTLNTSGAAALVLGTTDVPKATTPGLAGDLTWVGI